MSIGLQIDLSRQVVAVTGASSGIGEATALACARAGAAVSLAARSQPADVAVNEVLVRPRGQAR